MEDVIIDVAHISQEDRRVLLLKNLRRRGGVVGINIQVHGVGVEQRLRGCDHYSTVCSGECQEVRFSIT